MLATQINYWNYVEGKRHNLTTESQGQQNINETIRHNVRTEGQTDFYNSEMKRHNTQSENIGFIQANAAMSNAAAANLQAKASMQNVKSNRLNAKANYQGMVNNAPLLKARTFQTKQSVYQGWVNAGSNVVNAVGNLI